MKSTTFFQSARRAATVTPRSVISTSRLGIDQLRFSSTVHDNDPNVLESEKKKNLTGKQYQGSAWEDNAPGWNEYLATASEAAVKADRSDDGSPQVLQRKSVEHIRQRHHADDITEGKVEAQYERDEIEGPLRSALGSEESTVEERYERDEVEGPLKSAVGTAKDTVEDTIEGVKKKINS